MDSNTGLVVLGTAIGSKELVLKLLGPTAGYLGDGLKTWTERRVQNVAAIFKRAERIAGEDMNRAGAVPPRVLKEILNEGSFCEDELMAEYFGGLLAASRSNYNADDRAMAYTALVGSLSTYQIKSPGQALI